MANLWRSECCVTGLLMLPRRKGKKGRAVLEVVTISSGIGLLLGLWWRVPALIAASLVAVLACIVAVPLATGSLLLTAIHTFACLLLCRLATC
jgi:hypothetical protein